MSFPGPGCENAGFSTHTPRSMKLYTYWRSQAAFRVRIALNLKGLEAQLVPLDILAGDQHSEAYGAVNPQRVVPTLIEDDGHRLMQSLAILEYLEECHPEPPLLPAGARSRAYVRALALTLAGDSHPFVTPRVRKYLEDELHVDVPTRTRWMLHWMTQGLNAAEAQLSTECYAGHYCCGDVVSLADACLVPHINALQAAPDFDFGPYPVAMGIFRRCLQQEAFRAAAPAAQPDAPVSTGR
jgi:maleylacetoacetate isomerase